MIKRSLATQGVITGEELWTVYYESCHAVHLPFFHWIYAHASDKILKRDIEQLDDMFEQKEQLLRRMESGKPYAMEDIFAVVEDTAIAIVPEILLFDLLLQHHYSFEKQQTIFNSPYKGVW